MDATSKLPELSNYTCVNFAYNNFTTKFASTIGSVAPTKSLRVKTNTKPYRLDTGRILSVYKTFRRTSSERLMHIQFTSCVQGVGLQCESKAIHIQDRAYKICKGSGDDIDYEKLKEARPKPWNYNTKRNNM